MNQINNTIIKREDFQKYLSERFGRKIIIEKISVGIRLDSNESTSVIVETGISAKETFITSNDSIKEILKEFNHIDNVNIILNIEATIKDNDIVIIVWWR